MQRNNLHLTTRFKVTGIAAGALLIGTFLFFLHHYTPEQKQVSDEAVAIDSRSNANVIRSILDEEKNIQTHANDMESLQGDGEDTTDQQNQESELEAVPESKILTSVVATQPEISQQRSHLEEQRETAAQSPISVYGGEPASPASDNQLATHNGQPQMPIEHSAKDRGFLEASSDAIKTSINDAPHPPHTQFEVKAGSLIPAILETSINSDLPGKIIAKVSQNVYDTVTGNYLLIPQGTTLLGTYDDQVGYGQQRALVVWQRLIFPNGMSMQLEGQPGADSLGHAGLHDQVNNHYMRVYGSAMMFSILSAAGQLSQPKKSGDKLTTQDILYASVGQEVAQVGAQAIAKNLAIQPTIEIRAGTHLNVMLGQDLILHDVYHF